MILHKIKDINHELKELQKQYNELEDTICDFLKAIEDNNVDIPVRMWDILEEIEILSTYKNPS
tara:strand:- start:801 stop:989 length:189 start_codon:yes stop_codon:yes gene_type:complete